MGGGSGTVAEVLDNRAVAVIQHAVALGAQLEVRGVLRGLVLVGEVTQDSIALPDVAAGTVRCNGNARRKKPKGIRRDWRQGTTSRLRCRCR